MSKNTIMIFGVVALLALVGYFVHSKAVAMQKPVLIPAVTGSLTYTRDKALMTNKGLRYNVHFQYVAHPQCDPRTSKDIFQVDADDGTSILASCIGVSDHAYTATGTYHAHYTRDGIELTDTLVKVE